jgi:hypothetical protein
MKLLSDIFEIIIYYIALVSLLGVISIPYTMYFVWLWVT